MQFKPRGGRIQVLAYRGRCPVRGRSIVRMIGSIDAETLEPIGEIMDDATEVERSEIKEFIAKVRQERIESDMLKSVIDLPETLRKAMEIISKSDYLPSPHLDAKWADDVLSSFSDLACFLTRFFDKGDSGVWRAVHDGEREAVTEQDVIADCNGQAAARGSCSLS